jgi:glycosyltransferase involved in cell wall biosynthesis
MPIGLLAFASQRLGLITTFQGHLAMIAFWPIACLCMGVFFFGFRLVLLLPIAAYLSIVALQAGIPVVVSKMATSSELIRHSKAGVIVNPSDVNSVTEALTRLIRNPRLIDELKSRAMQYALRAIAFENAVNCR